MIKLNHKHRIMQGELEENWSEALQMQSFFPKAGLEGSWSDWLFKCNPGGHGRRISASL